MAVVAEEAARRALSSTARVITDFYEIREVLCEREREREERGGSVLSECVCEG
ncbi:MAG: hypothetical protein P4L40_03835 [Terracidiphilus sp.]|nr:hypothetical protein [Terracidiphilus sp.]